VQCVGDSSLTGDFEEDVNVYCLERRLVDAVKDREAEEKRTEETSGVMMQFGMGSRMCIRKNISLLLENYTAN